MGFRREPLAAQRFHQNQRNQAHQHQTEEQRGIHLIVNRFGQRVAQIFKQQGKSVVQAVNKNGNPQVIGADHQPAQHQSHQKRKGQLDIVHVEHSEQQCRTHDCKAVAVFAQLRKNDTPEGELFHQCRYIEMLMTLRMEARIVSASGLSGKVVL